MDRKYTEMCVGRNPILDRAVKESPSEEVAFE